MSIKETIIERFLFCCAFVSVLTTLGVIVVLCYESATFFSHVSLTDFLTDTEWTPLFAEKRFGILPLVAGTVLVSGIALILALPLGLLIAIYLSQFASASARAMVKPLLEILAGVPTIVYGYFALLFVTPALQMIFPELPGFNALSPGIVMGFMILPMVASLSEDALYAVPQSFSEGAYALGSTRLQTTFRVVLPAAFGGIAASFILAVSRAVGETMIVAIAAGLQPNLTLNPFSPVETMTTYIIQISMGDVPHGTLEYQTLFAVASVLFVITLLLNFVSIRLKERFRYAYL